jgi:hypothetical protein
MSDLIYANIDDSGACVGVVVYHQPVTPTANMIPIETVDEALLNKRWTGFDQEELSEDEAVWEDIAPTPESARAWRDGELLLTDWVAAVSDHPQREAYMTYRIALRDWPTTSDFPATKPELGS